MVKAGTARIGVGKDGLINVILRALGSHKVRFLGADGAPVNWSLVKTLFQQRDYNRTVADRFLIKKHLWRGIL